MRAARPATRAPAAPARGAPAARARTVRWTPSACSPDRIRRGRASAAAVGRLPVPWPAATASSSRGASAPSRRTAPRRTTSVSSASARRVRPRAMVEFDPYSYEVHEDPYPFYKRLRDEAPAYWNERVKFWALSRHADVLAAFKDSARYSNAGGVSLERSSAEDPSAVAFFLAMDPPRHDQLRNLVSRAFTPRRVTELEPRIRALTAHYIDRVVEAGRCDFIGDFAARLPMDVISELLGVPSDDRDELREWADLVLHREPGVSAVPPAGVQATMRLLGYFTELVADRRRRPGQDLTSALVEAELDGERLSDRDIKAFLFLMVIAGNETTTKLLGNALYWLWRNPPVRALVRDDPAMVPRWVEETLRYDSS